MKREKIKAEKAANIRAAKSALDKIRDLQLQLNKLKEEYLCYKNRAEELDRIIKEEEKTIIPTPRRGVKTTSLIIRRLTPEQIEEIKKEVEKWKK